ncbi:hypothetical protein H072_6739 [Dactylellina haptotyla CBS 200.50]|uniref:Uncharacterized protein n=1 Tax=Dactylellina haptotyla (strain CBS 200.50) TaxID=1284197 RepID=S8AED5_DACHA|nr:hypothetical protein H072_6739 [Dactylellina haptotyla CBS 200.50]
MSVFSAFTQPPAYTEKPSAVGFYEVPLQEHPSPSPAEIEASEAKYRSFRRRLFLLKIIHLLGFITWIALFTAYIVFASHKSRSDEHGFEKDKTVSTEQVSTTDKRVRGLHFIAGSGLIAALVCGFSSLTSLMIVLKAKEKRQMQEERGEVPWKLLPWWLECKTVDVCFAGSAVLQFVLGGVLIVGLK